MPKIMLITGASTGIGAATAILAAQHGYTIALHYNTNRDAVQAVAAQVETHGVQASIHQADLSDARGPEALFASFDSVHPSIDVLVNNAGIVDHAAPVRAFTPDRLQRMFATNLIGPMLCAAQAVRRMQPRGRGVILNVSSVAARNGSANEYVDYAASKAALDAFTKGLSDEIAAAGLRTVSVRPGLIDTDIHAKGGAPGRAQRLATQVPMHRAGQPVEIAQTLVWLASDAASYITGTTIDVSGGR